MKSTLKVSRSEVLTEIQSLPSKLRKTAKALYGRTSKHNRTPASIPSDEKKKIMALYKAGLAYRLVEAVAHMTPRNGMSAHNLLKGNKKAPKAAKAKKVKTPKAKKVAQTGTVTPDTATKHVPEAVAPVAQAPAPVPVVETPAVVVETPTVATPAPAPVAQTEATQAVAQ